MNVNVYTLDRFEGDYAIFLKRPEETEQLLLHRTQIKGQVKEGDLVKIKDDGQTYQITPLQKKTERQKKNVQNILDRLKNRKLN